MEEKEKQELLHKILSVDNDPKMARVATTVFVNKASKEEAKYFLSYLEHTNPAVKKIARSILGQKGVLEACEILINEFTTTVEKLTFMPDAEYQESTYYQNLIEMLETIFTIAKNETLENELFLNRIDDIFKKTKNEDLRFSLIKLIGLLGDRLDYFMGIYDDLTEKERRGLYYVYTFVNHPRRIEIYSRGLHDERNFEYVIANMLNFDEGKKALADQLLSLGSYNKQAVLKKLQTGKYPEFNDVLIKLLSDKNKFLVELSIENLKNNISSDFSLDPFIQLVETGYSPEGILGALEIISHFVKKNPEDIYLSGLEKQPSHKNKTYILDFFINQLKNSIKPTEPLTEKVLPKLLVYFDNFAKDKEELFISIFKIVPNLWFNNSSKLKSVKKKIITFKRDFENRLSTQFKNNLGEFVVKVNQLIARFEEEENKVKNIVVLFDIDPKKIDHDRMLKLKEQLNELGELDKATTDRLIQFLIIMFDVSRIDWKIKSVTIELLGDYGDLTVLNQLKDAAENESSLAVKVAAQKAATKVEQRFAATIESVMIIEPLFYIQKKLNEFFASKMFRVFNLESVEKLPGITEKFFTFLVITDAALSTDSLHFILEYLDINMDTILIIVTAKEEVMKDYSHLPNVRFLRKPFNEETLTEIIA
jgi:hypothetical protein